VGEKKLRLNILHSFGSAAGKGYKDSIGIVEEDGVK